MPARPALAACARSVMARHPTKTSRNAPTPRRGQVTRGRGQRTRAALMSAAEVVFERDGFLNARVADIAAQARVAHGSFYTYFDSKEDIFLEIIEMVTERIYESMDAIEADNAVDEISAANLRYVEVYEQHGRVLGLIEEVSNLAQFQELRRSLRRRSVQRAERRIARLEARGAANLEQLDRHMVATALVGMVDSFAYTWFVLREPMDRGDALAALDGIWLRTLGIEPAAR